MSKKILVIDDDPLILKTISKMLEGEGLHGDACQSGREALAIVNGRTIDLVISDIRMPGMDGVETIHLMIDRYKAADKDTPPFIFITGYADELVNQQARELEPTDFICKPFNRYDFILSVKSALNLQAGD